MPDASEGPAGHADDGGPGAAGLGAGRGAAGSGAAASGAAGSGAAGSGAGVDVIVVAAGRSSRMAGTDKLRAPLAGRPLLARTLESVAASGIVRRIVVVVAPERVEELRAAPWMPAGIASIVAGGARRQESVAAGLAELDRLGSTDEDDVVLIHDGARPLVSAGLVERVAAAAARHGAAIPVVPVAETIKRVQGDRIVETVDRSALAAAQTPQGFRRALLRRAHREVPPTTGPEWTDEASLLEACRIPVHVVHGDPTNLKVTVPDDLVRAEALVEARRRTRVGIGHDSHPFGPGTPLALGGIEIAGGPRLHGHSDGDVALHALADALLGAAGLGDLGRIFPAGPATPAGVPSAVLLADVVHRVAAAGYRPTGIDLTIIAARPRLGAHLDPIRDALAHLLTLPPEAVNVKASTGNLAGMEGAGRGISAEAIAQLESLG